MSAAQTSILDVMPIGVSGQLSDLETDEFGGTDALVNTDTVSIAFGVLAQRDETNLGGAKEVTANTNIFAGVSIFDRVYDFPSERDADGPLPGLPMTFLRKGRILVQTLGAVTADTGEVHVWIGAENRSASPPVYKGSFVGTATSGSTIKLPTGAAKWRTTLGAAGIAELEIFLPAYTEAAATAD